MLCGIGTRVDACVLKTDRIVIALNRIIISCGIIFHVPACSYMFLHEFYDSYFIACHFLGILISISSPNWNAAMVLEVEKTKTSSGCSC